MTGPTPLVSVVIPTYNNAEYVDIAVQSVLDQSLSDFEILISDHGSSDATLEAVRRYGADPRVHVHQVERSNNPVDNWIAVTAQARGTYLKLLCADDYLVPHCLERQVSAAQRHNAVLVASRRTIVDEGGRTLVDNWGLPRLARRTSGSWALRQAVRVGTNPFGEPACVLMKREAFVEAGGWDPQQQYLVDLEAYSRVLQLGDFVGLPESMAAFRVSLGQWSVQLAGQQRREMAAWQRDMRQRNPNVISRWDVTRGAFMAAALTSARRLVYLKTGSMASFRRLPSTTSSSPTVGVGQ